MTKLLATTTLLLTLLVSPLMAKEKILKCNPKNSETPSYSYYRMKSSFLGFNPYSIRIGDRWMPFCKADGSVIDWSSEESKKAYFNPKRYMPVETIKGDNVITCVYKVEPDKVNYMWANNSLMLFRKVKIDFDLNSSTFCFAEGFEFGKKLKDYKDYRPVIWRCNKPQKDVQCEVVR